MANLLTDAADYDTPGSWGAASDGWPDVRGDKAHAMYVFANCVQSIPYGSYVLMSVKDRYGAKETCLRVSKDYIDELQADFEAAGSPSQDESVARREMTGKLLRSGNRDRAPRWW